jgi:hypothetical protein
MNFYKNNFDNYFELPEDPVFGTRYYLCFFIFFFDGSTWYQMQPKKFGKFFGLKKGDLVPG